MNNNYNFPKSEQKYTLQVPNSLFIIYFILYKQLSHSNYNKSWQSKKNTRDYSETIIQNSFIHFNARCVWGISSVLYLHRKHTLR